MRSRTFLISVLLVLVGVSGCTLTIDGITFNIPPITATPTATIVTPSVTPVASPTAAFTQAATPVAAAVNPNAPGIFRVIHASPGTPNLDIYLNRGAKPIIANLAFGTARSFLTYPPDTYLLSVRAAGSAPNSAPIFEHQIILAPDSALNVVAVGLLTQTQSRGFLLLSVPANRDPAFGHSRLQIINASPDAGPIDVTAGNLSIVQGLLYGDGTFVGSDLNPGTYTISINAPRPNNNAKPTGLTLPNTALNANTFNTLIVLGTVDKLHTLLLLDPTRPPPTPVPTVTQ